MAHLIARVSGAGRVMAALQMFFQHSLQNFRFGTLTRTWYSLSSPEGKDFAS